VDGDGDGDGDEAVGGVREFDRLADFRLKNWIRDLENDRT
jgi:hypothetical protein